MYASIAVGMKLVLKGKQMRPSVIGRMDHFVKGGEMSLVTDERKLPEPCFINEVAN